MNEKTAGARNSHQNVKALDWDDLRLFLAVARHGGLSGAARATGASPPTLGRRMLALERALAVELFRRLPGGYELTAKGRELLATAHEVEARVAPLATIGPSERRLPVKISAGTWMVRALSRQVDRIIDAEGRTALRFIAADRVLDINRRETVIGIRNQRPEQDGLVCRRVGQVRFAGYAANSAVRGWVRVRGRTPSARWLAAHGEPDDRIEVTHPANALDVALTGAGRALLPTFIGSAEPGLTQVTSPIAALQHDQWMVTRDDERSVPAVRSTIDRLYDVLRDLHAGP